MKKIADLLFLLNVIYFIFMAIAHFIGLKYPILFIYYDVPFYAYQDKIIAFAVIAYAALFFEAFRKVEIRTTAIVVLYITVLGLCSVNLSSSLAEVMKESQSTFPYWVQTFLILMIAITTNIFHFLASKSPTK